jgi:uncharacterized protein
MAPHSRCSVRSGALSALIAMPLLLGACATEDPVRIANPASEHCLALGGTLTIEDGPGGQVGWCLLPDGRRVEEWELWRERAGSGEG